METNGRKGLQGGWLAFFKIWSTVPIPAVMVVLCVLFILTLQPFGFILAVLCIAFGYWAFKTSKHRFYRLGVEHITPQHVICGLGVFLLISALWIGLETWMLPFMHTRSTDKHWEMPIILFAIIPFALQLYAYHLGQGSRKEK